MKTYDVAIIGAGISGMSLAHYCARAGLSTLVLEKAERPGGCFHSHRFGDGAEGFWLELGAHTCYNSYGRLIGIIEDCNVLGRLMPREKVQFKLLVGDELKSIPARLSFLELALGLPRMLSAKKEGGSMESYYSKIVGKGNYERVLGPVFDAIISQDARSFPADTLFKKRAKRKDVLGSFTLAGGLSTITDTIASEPGVTLLTGQEISSIEPAEGGFTVASGGKLYNTGYLALAVPPPEAAILIKGAYPELSAHLSKVVVGRVETVGVALHKDDVPLPPVAGIIASGESFYSAVSRDTVKDEQFRGFAFHFKPGLLDLDGKLGRICEVLKVNPGRIRLHVEKLDNKVPSLTVGHAGWVAEADRLIKGGGLLLTGNYFGGVAIEDCVSRSYGEFGRIRGAD